MVFPISANRAVRMERREDQIWLEVLTQQGYHDLGSFNMDDAECLAQALIVAMRWFHT